MKTGKQWQRRVRVPRQDDIAGVLAQLVGWTLFAVLMTSYGYSIAQLAGIVS